MNRVALNADEATRIVLDLVSGTRSHDRILITNVDVVLPRLCPGVIAVLKSEPDAYVAKPLYVSWLVIFEDAAAAVEFKLRFSDFIAEDRR